MFAGTGVGAAAALMGLFVSNAGNSAPSGTIVLVVSAMFILSDGWRRARLSTLRRQSEEVA